MRKYFGTDGIRGIVNKDLTVELSYKVAKAAAIIFSKNGKIPTFFIGKDTRISGDLIESAMVAGFLSAGANVEVLGVIPTPGVAYLTRRDKADSGVVISASHNPYEYNGIKFFSNKGMKISDEIEEKIEELVDSNTLDNFNKINEEIGKVEYRQDKALEYVKMFSDLFEEKFTKLNKENFKVLIDASNGATSNYAKKIFDILGVDCDVISNTPNGININDNCGSTHLENLQAAVKSENYSLGVAYDGDGDRCLLVDDLGEVIDGDIILAVVAKYLVKENRLKDNTIVATVMSNLGLGKFAKENNMNLIKANVGDRYVLEEMLKSGYSLGGEQSGHTVFLDYNPTGDGMLTSIMVIKILLTNSEKMSEAKKIVSIYPQVLVNAKVNNAKKYGYLEDELIKTEILKLEKEFDGNGRVLIRTSGTEPLVRVMIEGMDQKYIEEKAKFVANIIEERLG